MGRGILYGLYGYGDIAYSGSLECFFCKYETGWRLYNKRCAETAGGI